MHEKEVKTLEEIEIIEIHCWERISESKIEQALRVVSDVHVPYDSSILHNSYIAELRELVRMDPHVMTENGRDLPLYYSHLKAIASNINDILLCGLADCGSIYTNSITLADLTSAATYNFSRYQRMATQSLLFIRLDDFVPLVNEAVQRITMVYMEKIQALWQSSLVSTVKATPEYEKVDIRSLVTSVFSEIAGVATYDDNDDDGVESIEDFINEGHVIHSRDDHTHSITLVTFENLKEIVTKVNGKKTLY
jgi:hypothetical protein